MPKIQKQFHLELTVEQFLNACSLLELQEVNLLLDGYLKKAEHEARRKAYREGRDPDEVEAVEAEEVDDRFAPLNQFEGIQSILQRAMTTKEIEPLKKRKRLGFDEDF